MKKLIVVIFSLLFIPFQNIISQSVEKKQVKLTWLDNLKFKSFSDASYNSFGDDKIIVNPFENTYTKTLKLDANTADDITISNVLYEDLAQNYSFKNVNGTSNFITKVVSDRNSKYISIQFNPLIVENNKKKRVISFDVRFNTSSIHKITANKSSLKQSVLSNGRWFKFAVDKSGVYKIDKSFLQNLGVDLNNTNPKYIKIYGNGGKMLPLSNNEFRYDGLQENSIMVMGENDGVFNDEDYILFYAQGPDVWEATNPTDLLTYTHQKNIYSNEAYYFLTVGNTSGKRIPISTSTNLQATKTVTTYHDFYFHENDEINLFGMGQQWFGEDFNVTSTQQFTIPFRNSLNTKNLILNIRGVASSGLNSSMNISINNQQSFILNYGPKSGLTYAVANAGSYQITPRGDSVQIQIDYNNNGNPSAKAYLDYIEILGEKKLVASNQQFEFQNIDTYNSGEIVNYKIENANEISQVWDITNFLNPVSISNISNGNIYEFTTQSENLQKFIALSENDFYEPIFMENSSVKNQNLHSLSEIDYVIVTTEALEAQATRLATFHSQNSNLKVQVVLLSQIYNEFSSGAQDITAIRDFIRHLYTNSTTNKIKYVCLFGDASFDFKDRIKGNTNMVPAFQSYNSFNLANSYVTDDFYGMMDENEGAMNVLDKQDVYTGRIPAKNAIEAEQMVSKILNYYSSNSLGNWHTNIALIADDIDNRGEEIMQFEMEQMATKIAANKPIFNLKKIYLDAYQQESFSGGHRYPQVNKDLENQVAKGTLLINYFGHGGYNGWAHEGILDVPTIQNFSNYNKLPLFITVTCEFARFDDPLRETAGEYLIKNPKGGSSALISTTRAIYISVGQAINSELTAPLLNFNNTNFSISETLAQVKNKFSTAQRFFIYYFGDPAMHLAIPKPSVKIIKMNGKVTTQQLDTIKALSKINFEGEIIHPTGGIMDNFNGEVDVTVFDKAIKKTTLDNDNKGVVMPFETIESKLFTGKASVKNGNFSFNFVAPKDLKIAYGKGKISLYSTNNTIEKAGYNNDIIIGGLNEDAVADNIGPTIQLYMNDLNFMDGDQTNSSPNFMVVLEDENGINTSLTAVDHDIVAILDNNQSNPIILNEFYTTELDNYKKGKVSYPLKDLSPGLHTITLKAWDTYNNSSEATLNFVVVDDTDLKITKVLNYPNPFINYTQFWFNHNKPNALLQVQVQIFTVSGKLVKTINESVTTAGNTSRSITWNGLDDFGNKIGKGVYIYTVKVKDLQTNTSVEKIEKLVILQ